VSAASPDALEVWRERALTTVARIGAVVSILNMGALTPSLALTSVPVLGFAWAIVALNVAVAVVRSAPYRLRAWTWVVSAFAAGFGSILLFSFHATAVALALAAVVFAGIFLGRTATVAVAGAFLAGLALMQLLPAEILEYGVLHQHRIDSLEPILTAVALTPTVVQLVVGLHLVVHGLEGSLSKAQAALGAAEASDRRFRAIFEGGPDVVALVAVPGERFLDVNLAFERVLGYRREEAIGKTPAELGLVEATEPRWGERILARRHVEGIELRMWTRGGERLEFELSLRVVELAGGKAAVAIARDVTPQRRLAGALRHAQRVHAVGTLSAGIVHNFRNALGSVMPNLEYCWAEAPEALRPALDDARQSAAAAVELANDLTRLARGEGDAAPVRVEVLAVLRDVVGVCTRTFGAAIRVQARGLEGEVFVRTNAAALRHAFLNLCLNARDALREGRGGELVLVAEQGVGRLFVTVSDDGPGMPPEVVRRLGEPFFTTKTEGRGTGLGVSTALSAIREAGGEITWASVPGEGTSVLVELPIAAQGHVPLRGARGGRALVVGGEAAMLAPLGRQLEGLGFEPELVQDLPEVLRRLEEGAARYDILVVDRELDPAEGARLARAARAPHGVPVVAVADRPDVPGPSWSDAVVVRPVATFELAEVIARTWGLDPAP